MNAAPSASTTTIVFSARALRDFGDGFAVLLVPFYLAAHGLGAFEIGIVATLGLLGSAVTTLAIGMISHQYGERVLLIAASLLMAATGVAFAFSKITGLFFLIAFLGTINPSSGSVSIFVPLEHAVLASSVSDRRRTSVFAYYSLIGALAASFGSLAVASPEWLKLTGLSELDSFRLMFVFYAALGLAGAVVYAHIPHADAVAARPRSAPLSHSRAIVFRLAALFSVDAFAGGLVVPALMALWLLQKFGLSLTSAGAFFMAAGLLGAISQPIAGWLGARVGLVNTMVWTHIPANLALIAAALAPSLELP